MPPPGSELPDFPSSQLFLRRLAYSLVRDATQAEDLVQDTWAAWVEHGPRDTRQPRAWLARVLRNHAFNLGRSDARRTAREAERRRPDASEPETDGTLEAQARLIEALRALEEPYRSTLVQRYYHDLAPSAIAERTGTPLNTVKARLARGLEKLRGALDKRYGGDRGAWCHWLTVLGTPVPLGVGSGAAAGSAGSLAGVGAGMSTLGWVALIATLVAGAVWKVGWPRTAEQEARGPSAPESRNPVSVPLEARGELGRVAVESEGPRAVRPKPAPLSSPEAPSPSPPSQVLAPVSARPAGEREDFDWPQYAGGPTHVNFREREDEILAPKVLWFVPGCAGQPTLRDNDLYTGGLMLMRIDPSSGAVLGASVDTLLAMFLMELEAATSSVDEIGGAALLTQALQAAVEDNPNDPLFRSVADAPVVTANLVLARRTFDGGVDAYDRELASKVWSWTPKDCLEFPEGRPREVPLCLASEELVLVPLGVELVALRLKDGSEAWRFDARHESLMDGTIQMVPACVHDMVFFGLGWSRFYALRLRTGEEVWQAHLGGQVGWTAPVVLNQHVLFAERGLAPAEGDATVVEDSGMDTELGHLRLLELRSGKERWATELAGAGLSLPGIGPGERYAVAGFGEEVSRFDLATGKIDPQHRLATGANPFGSPTVVGKSLVYGDLDGQLYVHDIQSGKPRWSFRAPQGAQVHEFVHSGQRLYVATSVGLFCLGDDPKQAPPPEGWVLQWSGDTRKLSYKPEEE